MEKSYEFYKELFWEKISGKHWLYAYDGVLCLNKMAEILGYPDDPAHWNETVGMDNLQHQLELFWEIDTPNMFGETGNGIGWSNVAPSANSMFPREWVVKMAENWLDDSVR